MEENKLCKCPKIGVITPMYNNADTILTAIKSVQNQEAFTKNEPYGITHYIYDDFSTDNSVGVVVDFIIKNNISNIKIFPNQENKGQSNARNVLIKKALYQGCGIIAFLDADDSWHSNHLKLNIGKKQFDNCFHYSQPECFQNNQQVWPMNIPIPKTFDGEQFKYNNFIWISSVIVDAKLLIGEEFDSSLDSVEDWDFWWRLYLKSSKMPINFIDNGTTTVRYNVNPNGQAGKSDKARKLLVERYGFKL